MKRIQHHVILVFKEDGYSIKGTTDAGCKNCKHWKAAKVPVLDGICFHEENKIKEVLLGGQEYPYTKANYLCNHYDYVKD